MHDEILSTKALSVGYAGRALVQNIEIHLCKGEILTLAGPNGSGKTTLLKTIAAHLAPVNGTAFLLTQNMAQMSSNAIAQKLAVVLTSDIRPERMSCEDVVAAGRYPYTGRLGMLSAEDKAEVHSAMEMVHTLALRTAEFDAISDGQRQRVLLARAICQKPQVILLDEPTSFLDVKYKLELLSILKSMARKQDVAIILSLHELDLVQKISDQVLCIRDGQIEKYGAPDAIFTDDYIRHLYDIQEGSYNSVFGSLELKASTGAPLVFVIAGGGSGIRTFRQLQRQDIPFATGVLHQNDVDYKVAQTLASVVIAEEMFEPISAEKLEEAKRVMRQCKRVICCLHTFGTMNGNNQALLAYAKQLGLPITAGDATAVCGKEA